MKRKKAVLSVMAAILLSQGAVMPFAMNVANADEKPALVKKAESQRIEKLLYQTKLSYPAFKAAAYKVISGNHDFNGIISNLLQDKAVKTLMENNISKNDIKLIVKNIVEYVKKDPSRSLAYSKLLKSSDYAFVVSSDDINTALGLLPALACTKAPIYVVDSRKDEGKLYKAIGEEMKRLNVKEVYSVGKLNEDTLKDDLKGDFKFKSIKGDALDVSSYFAKHVSDFKVDKEKIFNFAKEFSKSLPSSVSKKLDLLLTVSDADSFMNLGLNLYSKALLDAKAVGLNSVTFTSSLMDTFSTVTNLEIGDLKSIYNALNKKVEENKKLDEQNKKKTKHKDEESSSPAQKLEGILDLINEHQEENQGLNLDTKEENKTEDLKSDEVATSADKKEEPVVEKKDDDDIVVNAITDKDPSKMIITTLENKDGEEKVTDLKSVSTLTMLNAMYSV